MMGASVKVYAKEGVQTAGLNIHVYSSLLLALLTERVAKLYYFQSMVARGRLNKPKICSSLHGCCCDFVTVNFIIVFVLPLMMIAFYFNQKFNSLR